MGFGFLLVNHKDKVPRRRFFAVDMKGPEFVGGVLMGVHLDSQVQLGVSRLQGAIQVSAAVL